MLGYELGCVHRVRNHLLAGNMIKYLMTAAALKFFSATPQTRSGYRLLGNSLGQRKRIQNGLDWEYVERVKRVLQWCRQYDIVHAGDHVLEIGTGWLHWEATLIRLFYDVEATLFDVWDNRQLEACKSRYAELDNAIDDEFALDETQRARVHHLLSGILHADSFDDIYRLLNFRHVIDPSGTLTQFADQSFSLIVSSNVLEHVSAKILPGFIRDFYRLLEPGGYSVHQIDLGDHLSYYDGKTSLKNYLRYSDTVWRRCFENEVQYFNRVQRSEWMTLFCNAGLELVEEEPIEVDIGPISIDKRYAAMDQQDLWCRTLRVVHRRPL